MSSKKIIRLKTPARGKDFLKSPHDYYEHSANLDEQTIMKGFRQQSTENVYSALIEELNKSYKQIENLKDLLLQTQQLKESLLDENQLLKGRLEMLDRQCSLQKEKYILQRENHQRLRQFYEKREKQWMGILSQQRRLIQNCDIRKDQQDCQGEKDAEGKAETTARTRSNEESQSFPFFQSREGFQKRLSSKGIRPMKKSLSASKNRLSQGHNFFHAAHGIFLEETKLRPPKSERKSAQKPLKSIREGQEHKVSYHNQESDELFETILRKTFYRIRDEGKTLADVAKSQDMDKLKRAKTSTRQRLEKTLKKLKFDIQSQIALKTFCDHLEKEILARHKEFRGDFVFCYLMEKLTECESFAFGTNSAINNFCSQQQSEVSVSVHQQREEKKKDKEPETSNSKKIIDSGTLIEQLKSSNFELLLTSNVRVGNNSQKAISVMKEAQVSEVVRHSDDSSLGTLSDLINASRDYLQDMTRV